MNDWLANLSREELGHLRSLIITEPDPLEWDFQPADPVEFIESPYYCNLKRQCAQCIKDDFRKTFVGPPLEWETGTVILDGAIGCGKSYELSLMMAYIAHCLLCLHNPSDFFLSRGHQISAGSKLTIVNTSLNKTNARKVVFNNVSEKIINNRWFMTHYPPDDRIKTELIFDPSPESNKARLRAIEEGRIFKNVCIFPGSSSAASVVGYDVFCGVLDEATLFQDEHGENKADSVFQALNQRIISRFGSMGMRIAAGSPMYTEDFLERKIREAEIKPDVRPQTVAERVGHKIYAIRRTSWDRKHPDWFKLGLPVFHVHKETLEIVESPDTYEPEDDRWVMVPKLPAYLAAFKENPDGAMRNLAAIALAALARFFEDPLLIERNVNVKRIHPVKRDGSLRETFKPINPDVKRNIHIDMAMGGRQTKRLDTVDISAQKSQKHDALGIAMGHISGKDVDGEDVFYIDFMHKIMGQIERRTPRGKIIRSAIRGREIIEWCKTMRALGFDIGLVTTDGFQSEHLLQGLQDAGFNVGSLSVDIKPGPYNDFKEAILDNRVDYYYHPVFIKECKSLERIAGKKIDHAPGSSKDLADAVCGVCYSLALNPQTGPAKVSAQMY